MSASRTNSVVGLIGGNGAGKTTFINMVTGYLKPDHGTILYCGRDITQLAPAQYHAARHLPLVSDSAAVR